MKIKALAKLGALLVLCVALAGVSIADRSEHITLDAEQVAQITFSEDVSASASYETNNAEEIEQIVNALQQLKLQKIDTAIFEADLTEESIDTFVWLQYADEARAEEQNADIVFFFCKNGTVGIQQADNSERYYQVDYTELKALLHQIGENHLNDMASVFFAIEVN